MNPRTETGTIRSKDTARDRDGNESLGAELEPGATHYRAFVGPPRDYDLVAAMTFSLLTALGLRQHHDVLDVGCGSLRIGRLLIPYLNRGRYTGLEPNSWLVAEGIQRECGPDQIEIKQPHFVFEDNLDSFGPDIRFDFAIAQSIFSHAGLDVISRWLADLGRVLPDRGALIATYIEGEEDHPNRGWIYPECVSYRRSTIEGLATDFGFEFRPLDWRHPRQSWALFTHEGFPTDWLDSGALSWNHSFDAGRWS